MAKSVLIVGGTGFIGSHAALKFLEKGYKVTTLSMTPPKNGLLPKEVDIITNNIDKMDPEGLCKLLKRQYAVVYAAGADDRVTPPKPANKYFYQKNVISTVNFFTLAKEAGVKRGVLLSSYFAYFDALWPNMALSKHHPYIKSRLYQEKQALIATKPELELMILQLPYIFGSAVGMTPLWKPLIQYIKKTPWIFYTKGGTNMISVEHVAEAIVGAIENGKAGKKYVIGDQNLTWQEFLGELSLIACGKKKRIITIPNFLAKLSMSCVKLKHSIKGREGGLDMVKYVDLQTKNTFFDPGPERIELGYGSGGLTEAFKQTIKASK